MRFARGDMRDHIALYQNDHRPSYWPQRALRQQECLKIDFREIFRVVRFSTFATLSAHSDISLQSSASVALGAKRTSTGEQDRLAQSRMTPMYGPAVRCKRFSSIRQIWSCINVSGLCLERHHGYQRAFELISEQASSSSRTPRRVVAAAGRGLGRSEMSTR